MDNVWVRATILFLRWSLGVGRELVFHSWNGYCTSRSKRYTCWVHTLRFPAFCEHHSNLPPYHRTCCNCNTLLSLSCALSSRQGIPNKIHVRTVYKWCGCNLGSFRLVFRTFGLGTFWCSRWSSLNFRTRMSSWYSTIWTFRSQLVCVALRRIWNRKSYHKCSPQCYYTEYHWSFRQRSRNLCCMGTILHFCCRLWMIDSAISYTSYTLRHQDWLSKTCYGAPPGCNRFASTEL